MRCGVRVELLAALCASLLACTGGDAAPAGTTAPWMGSAPPTELFPTGTPDAGGNVTTTGQSAGGLSGDAPTTSGLPAACARGALDTDGDGSPDCEDGCPADALKSQPGECGCGTPEPTAGGSCESPCTAGEANCGASPGTDQPDGSVPDGSVPDETLCTVQPITEELRAAHSLHAVYTRYASGRGVPVVGTDSPSDESLRRACMMIRDLSQEPKVLETMLEKKIGLVVMGADETMADLPDFAVYGVPDSRARGLGTVPRGLCAEENVMCDTSRDRWRGESICVHEFAHTMHLGVYNLMDRTFNSRVEAAYSAALAAGKYRRTYAESNAVEYFAEAVQDWYNTNLESTPANGVHNEINTRAELEAYDPEIYAILAEVLPDEPSYTDCYNHE